MGMNYKIIESSSKGNSTIVEDILMLDCGLSYSKIKKYLKKVKIIFVSHQHKDHLLPRTIQQISYNFPTIKFLTGSKEVVNILATNNVSIKNIIYIPNSSWYDLGMLKVKLELLEHDVENYALHFEIKNKKAIYIVDTASVENINAKDYDLYLVESNYKEDLLEYHKQNAKDDSEMFYLNRIDKTHLSYEKCNDFLINNMSNKSTFEYLHKSRYNFKEE